MKFLETKSFFIAVTVFGLIGVGISYYLGLQEMPNGLEGLWGNMPESMRSLYYITTSLAFIGFT